ncbi:hypothetical protein BVSY1_10190 [Bacillus velezensis]|nr:hypothetical protein BVSY1_10190 [Bacillus velezensis]
MGLFFLHCTLSSASPLSVDKEPSSTLGITIRLIVWTVIIGLGLINLSITQGAIDMNNLGIITVFASSIQAYLISNIAGTPLS